MAQVSYGNPDDESAVDIRDYVVLIHGDLGTGEQFRSILNCCSIEDQAWEQFQYALFCPGYFHIKMACAEALWHIFIKPALGCLDETSFMKDIGILRPKETGTIISKCEFQRMHQVINHTGIARRLDCWRTAMHQNHPQFATLEDFAKTKPKLDDL